MRRPRPLAAALAAVAILALALVAVPACFAAFASRTENGGNEVTAANDFRAPQVTAAVLIKGLGGATGFVKQGGEYFVYANVAADTGNPASGIASVRADVSQITTGSSAVVLSAGPFTVGGVTYGYRSAALSANAVLAEGTKGFTVTATDNALNAASLAGSATVDNTAPKASDVQTTNAGTNGLAEQNDTMVLSFSEPVEPGSILAGWDGVAPTNVTVRIVDNSLLGLGLGNDVVQVFNSANTAALSLGAVDLGRSDYVTGLIGGIVKFGAPGAPARSTMTISGNTLTVVLGTYEGEGLLGSNRITAAGTGTATWTPVATPYDRAANAMSTAAATESGAADKEF